MTADPPGRADDPPTPVAVLQELRDVAGKIYPPLLTEAGLGPALREATDRLAASVRVEAPQVRFGPATEGVAYLVWTIITRIPWE
jgi:hypothetical protein